jgi:hypothetical protein
LAQADAAALFERFAGWCQFYVIQAPPFLVFDHREQTIVSAFFSSLKQALDGD